ncbi:uncharacterized protein LOC132273185 [Cornus florida]|uniref:uncharacterized protein LOC132273185 n=1 Tax=Cornus florida TaxID=4283 RepID=UPI0028989E5E|nr:uncharacterized protein LOC132273185 [Cornus florida]
MLKHPIKQQLATSYSEISEKVKIAKNDLHACQSTLNSLPTNTQMRLKENELLCTYKKLKKAEESTFKQKSRIQWLKAGDSNTSYFFKSMNSRFNKNKITSILDSNGYLLDTEVLIKQEVISYFKGSLGSSSHNYPGPQDLSPYINQAINPDYIPSLLAIPSTKEIHKCMFSMNNEKSPGPNGYNVIFFKQAWPIIGSAVTQAIQQFFTLGKLL